MSSEGVFSKLSSLLSGVRELLVAKSWTSDPDRTNRTARDHHRTVVILAAWITPAHSQSKESEESRDILLHESA